MVYVQSTFVAHSHSLKRPTAMALLHKASRVVFQAGSRPKCLALPRSPLMVRPAFQLPTRPASIRSEAGSWPLATDRSATVLDGIPDQAVAAAPSLWQQLAQTAMRVAAVISIAFALLAGSSERALAASSGGRVGGNSFSRSSSVATRSSSSSSFSRPATAARSTVTHHHTTVISTGPSFGFGWGWGMPMWSPWGGVHVYSGFSVMGSIMTATLFAMAAFFVIKALRGPSGSGSSSTVAAYEDDDEDAYDAVAPVTVAKLQVGVLGVARTLKAQLDALGASADTRTPEGLHLVLTETVLGLLRNPHYAVYGYSSCTTLDSPEAAERAFGSMTLEERARVQHETLVNTAATGVRTAKLAEDSKEVSELVVITLMVAAEGPFTLPAIKSAADLKAALKALGAVTPANIMALELTWTPQAENDSLTAQEVMLEYPNLMPL